MSRSRDVGIAWYGLALAVYIAAGFFFKSVVLNWIVGPLFPLILLYLVPLAGRRLGRKSQLEPAE